MRFHDLYSALVERSRVRLMEALQIYTAPGIFYGILNVREGSAYWET
jgi:hypothetical protein